MPHLLLLLSPLLILVAQQVQAPAADAPAAPAAKPAAKAPAAPAKPKPKALASAVVTAIDISDLPDGDYIVRKRGGSASMSALKLLKPDGVTNPTDPPPTGPLTPFEQVIAGYTRAALTNEGGTKTTGAALSEIYNRVSAGVTNGTIKPENALPAVFAATNGLFKDDLITDDTSWVGWRVDVGSGLDKLKQDGELSTAAQYASALKQVSNGLNSVTGYTPQMQKLAGAATESGILDGIDIDKIIKLIELIMKLLTLFGI